MDRGEAEAQRYESRMKDALARHLAGDLVGAKRLYLEILQKDPENAATIHNLGLISLQKGELSEAVRLFEQAIEHRADYPEAYCNLGTALKEAGRLDEAIGKVKWAVTLNPYYPTAWYNLANTLRDAARLDEAVEAYQKAVELNPRHMEAHVNLGNTLDRMGRLRESATAYKSALSVDKDHVDARYNLANVLFKLERFQEAVSQYQHVLRLKPDMAASYCNLGNALLEAGDPEGALEAYKQALEHRPDYAEVCYNIANALSVQGRFEDAVNSCKRALGLKPNYAEGYYNLGNFLTKLDRFAEAVEAYVCAIALRPDYADAHYNLGNLLREQNRFEEAVQAYKDVTRIEPQHIEAYLNMGTALGDLGRLEDARACYEQAIAMEPYDARLPFNLAGVLKKLGSVGEAIAAYNRSIELSPAFTEAYLHLARTLEEQGEIDRAISIQQRALELCPDSTLLNNASLRMFVMYGFWKAAEPLIEKVLNARYQDSEMELLDRLLFILNSTFLSWQEILSKHIEWGNLQIARCRKENLKYEFSTRPSHECLRIGYLSPDFRRHSVGFLFKEIIAHHDCHSFKVYCYSLSENQDQVTIEIERCSSVYRQVSHLPAKSVAHQIIEDGIDILVDLAGHTKGNRLEVLGYKPAPIQVTALGYPNGTGLPTVEYQITDSFADLSSADEQYVEKLVRLPRCFIPFVDLHISPQSSKKEDLGIPSDAVIFVSFNALHKLNPHVLKLWNRILGAVPDAYLLFSFKHSHFDQLKNNILSHFKSGEDHTDRIRVLPRARTAELHRERYELADIALDTFPYSGTMTSYEALYLGVPVVTLVGERHVQRTTYSFLRNIGLDDGAATSEQEYFQKAISLAGNRKVLCHIKDRIRNAVKHPHLCARLYTKHLELAYRVMRDRYERGLKPKAINLSSMYCENERRPPICFNGP